uniref:Uncharacterized protein n=1 Tax=Panagrolaimus davidi TaxID=227884 RepID=A0A914PZ87_9BILA
MSRIITLSIYTILFTVVFFSDAFKIHNKCELEFYERGETFCGSNNTNDKACSTISHLCCSNNQSCSTDELAKCCNERPFNLNDTCELEFYENGEKFCEMQNFDKESCKRSAQVCCRPENKCSEKEVEYCCIVKQRAASPIPKDIANTTNGAEITDGASPTSVVLPTIGAASTGGAVPTTGVSPTNGAISTGPIPTGDAAPVNGSNVA